MGDTAMSSHPGLLIITLACTQERVDTLVAKVREHLAIQWDIVPEDLVCEVASTEIDHALANLVKAGVRDLWVGTTLLVEGTLWEQVHYALQVGARYFHRVFVALPLLSDGNAAQRLAAYFNETYAPRDNTAYVLVGHGSLRSADFAFQAVGYAINMLGRVDMLVATLKGAMGLAAVKCWLNQHSDIHHLELIPFMVQGSAHWERDVVGKDTACADHMSWRNALQTLGYDVTVNGTMLAHADAFIDMVAEHILEAPVFEERSSYASLFGVPPALPNNDIMHTKGVSARFPLFVDMANQPCLIVGGGQVGTRRARVLMAHKARVTIMDPRGPQFAVRNVRVLWHTYTPGDEVGYALVIAATDDRAVNRLIGVRCRRVGIPVSVADAPEEATFYFPALIDAPGVVCGLVSTDGNHVRTARVAANIRQIVQ